MVPVKNIILKILSVIICVFPLFKGWKEQIIKGRFAADTLSSFDRAVFLYVYTFWERFEYLKEKDPYKREAMKEYVMGGESGMAWAKHYQSEPIDLDRQTGELSYREAHPIFEILEKVIREKASNCDLAIFQVGCSSGREIAYFAEKFPDLTFIGTDIYDEVIDFASSAHKLENLKFIKIAANNMAGQFDSIEADEIIVFTSGCLAFVLPEHIDKLFNDISKCGKPVTLATQEATGYDVSNLTGKLPSSWAGSLSYSPQYPT